MKRKVLVAVVFVTTLFLATGLSAQTPKKGGTTLTGTVLGADGKPVAGAAVSCQSSGGTAPHAVHTDSTGKFVLSGLKQDSYDLRASANGTYSAWQRNIPLRRGQTKNVTLRLVGAGEPPSAVPVKQQAPPQ